MVEPELFYMPVKKKEKRIPLTLKVWLKLYDTLNIETMEYSNTRYAGISVYGNIVVFDKDMNIVYNSKADITNNWNIYGRSSFEIPNLSQGQYYVKVINVSNGGVVDNKLHEIELKENSDNKLIIYLKYHWTTITGKVNKEYVPDIYITHYGIDDEITNFSASGGIDRFEVFDDETNKIIAVVPKKEQFAKLHRVGYRSNTWGDFGSSIYTNGTSLTSYSFNYYYKSNYMLISSGYGYYYNVYHKGSISRQIVPNTAVAYFNKKVNEEVENNTCIDDIDVYKTYTESSFVDSMNRVFFTHISENEKRYQLYGGEEYFKSDDDFLTEGYSLAESNSCELSYCFTEKVLTDAISYYIYHKSIETNEIDNSFFYYGNYFIVQSKKTEEYSTIASMTAYNDDIESSNTTFIKKCRPYNISKYKFTQEITAEDLLINGLRSTYISIIRPFDGSMTTFGSKYYFYGYQKFDEALNEEPMIHIINDKLVSYSDDYDNY